MNLKGLESCINNCENVGRNYFTNVVPKLFGSVKNVKFSEILTERHDCIVEGKKLYIVELKVRNISSTKYDTIMIDPTKRSYLMGMMSKGYTPLYVNFFNDGKCLVWDLDKLGDKFTVGVRTFNKLTVNPMLGQKEFNRLFFKVSDAVCVDYTV